jgi:hypothetical protein
VGEVWWRVGRGPRVPSGHVEGRITDGGGRSRVGRMRRRSSSSVARAQSKRLGSFTEVNGGVGARNRKVAHRAARSTRGGGRMKSGDGKPAPPAKWCSV